MIRARAIAAIIALLTCCARSPAPAPAASGESPAAPPAEDAPLAKATVTVYFPSASRDGLTGETREIIATPRPADRGAQILSALLDGPEGDDALPLAREGTTLNRLWVRADGTAYADFSEELIQGLSGSSEEILTIYAIVDSLAMNVAEIKSVAVLINGRERDTLGGHIDARRPLPPDPTLVATAPGKE